MKATLSRPEHLSYKRHRRQTFGQIILPIILAASVMIALIVLVILATFGADGDVTRWAAIATIWLVIPIMFTGLIVLVVLIGLIYLMARGLQAIPTYSAIAQDFAAKARWYVTRGAHMLVKPFLLIESWLSRIHQFLGKVQ